MRRELHRKESVIREWGVILSAERKLIEILNIQLTLQEVES